MQYLSSKLKWAMVFCVKIKVYTDPELWCGQTIFCQRGGGFRKKEYYCLLLSLSYFDHSIGKYNFIQDPAKFCFTVFSPEDIEAEESPHTLDLP